MTSVHIAGAGDRRVQLILVRHAEPQRVDPGGGRADPHLTGLGHEQAARLVGALVRERVDALVTSPMSRARETAARDTAPQAPDVG